MGIIKSRGMLSQKTNSFRPLDDLTRTSEVVVAVLAGGATLMAVVVVEAGVWVVDTRMVGEVVVDIRVGVDTREVVVGTRMAGVAEVATMRRDSTKRGTSTTEAGVVAPVAILITTTREEVSREVAIPSQGELS